MDELNSLSGARAWAQAGRLEDWVHGYLLSAGHNPAFSEGLKLDKRYYDGPVNMPLSLLKRCCGPEEEMAFRVDEAYFEKHVAELQEAVRRGEDMPPLIVNYRAEGFVLNDGNHRFEALYRLGAESAWAIVWTSSQADREAFWNGFGGKMAIKD